MSPEREEKGAVVPAPPFLKLGQPPLGKEQNRKSPGDGGLGWRAPCGMRSFPQRPVTIGRC